MKVDMNELRAVLQKRREDGQNHVKATHLTDDLPNNSREIGHALARLAMRGELIEMFGGNSAPKTYRLREDEIEFTSRDDEIEYHLQCALDEADMETSHFIHEALELLGSEESVDPPEVSR